MKLYDGGLFALLCFLWIVMVSENWDKPEAFNCKDSPQELSCRYHHDKESIRN